jgi:hypothetical protein
VGVGVGLVLEWWMEYPVLFVWYQLVFALMVGGVNGFLDTFFILEHTCTEALSI